MSSKDMTTGLAVGLVAGTAIGMVVGFLYAPRPGAETRELMRIKTENIRESAAEALRKAKETAAEVRDRIEAKLT